MNIDIYNNIIAANAKKIIKEKGIKQYVVAKKAGFNPKDFSAMMNGRKIIKGCDITPIADALEVTPNDLCKE